MIDGYTYRLRVFAINGVSEVQLLGATEAEARERMAWALSRDGVRGADLLRRPHVPPWEPIARETAVGVGDPTG